MNKLIYFIGIIILSNELIFAQQKEVEQAIYRGKNSDGYYEVSKKYDGKKFKKWYSEHRNEYFILDYSAYEVVKYENLFYEVDWFAFVKNSELEAYKLKKLQELQEQRNAENTASLIKVGIAVGFIAIGVKACGYLIGKAYEYNAKYGGSTSYNNSSSYSNSSSSSSNNSNEKIEKTNKHDTRIKKIEFSDNKYLVSFINGNTLDVKVVYNKEYSTSSYNAYDIQWYDEDRLIKNKAYYWVVAPGFGALSSKNYWYACSRDIMNDCGISENEKDVVEYYIKHFYLE